CRRIASVSMVWVLPTPGAYPRKSLNLPVFFAGEHSSSHCSGVLGIEIIVVEILKGYKVVIQSLRDRRQIRIRIPYRGAICSRNYSRRLPLAPSESDHDCARFPAGRPRDLRLLGLAASGFHVGDRNSRIQLLFFAADRHL